MHCVKCGEKFADNLKYCPHCGTSIDTPAPEPENKGDTLGRFPGVRSPSLWFLGVRTYSIFWIINWYFPIFFICAFPAAMIFALFACRFLSLIPSAIGLALSLLFNSIKKGKIKAKKATAVILVVIIGACWGGYLELFKYDFSYYLLKYDWNEIKLSEQLPEPENNHGTISLNEDERFQLYLIESSIEEFNEYVEECKKAGFDNGSYDGTSRYYASNGGYWLSVYFHESERKTQIILEFSEEEEEETEEEIAIRVRQILINLGPEHIPEKYREYYETHY